MWNWQFHEAIWIRFRTPREIFISFRSPGGQMRFRTRKKYRFVFHSGYMILKRGKCYIAFCCNWETRFRTREICYIYRFPFYTCNTLSKEVSIHQRVYFHTCNTLSSKVSIHQCIKYCLPLRFPLHLHHCFRTGEMYIAFHSTRVTSWTMQMIHCCLLHSANTL